VTALDYVHDKGFEYKITAGQVVLKRCPFCGDERSHFYIDPGGEGLFFCHKCQERGNLVYLKKHFGDISVKSSPGNLNKKPQADGIAPAFISKKANIRPDPEIAIQAHERLLKNKEGLEYVIETRGISMEAITHFKLGLIDKDGTKWLAIPHYVRGELLNIKSRSFPPAEKTFRRIANCPSVLFNADSLGAVDTIFIAEGELDAISLWGRGIKNVVGVTTGAGSFDPEWIDRLKELKKIYLVYDPDEPGQKGAREVARRLGYFRCFNVVLPNGLDINEFFRSGMDIFDFQCMVNQAQRFDVAGIMSIKTALDQLSEDLKRQEIQTGIVTPWPSVNRLIPTGFQSGELIVLSAPPKIGKSSLALQIVWDCAMKNIPSLFYCLEMRPFRIVQKIVQGFTKSAGKDEQSINATKRVFSEKPLYLGYCYQAPELKMIVETLKEAIQRYGLKLLIFDHLHFLCRSVQNQVQEIGLAVRAFKFLAEEMEIPIVLIAQPRKIQPDSMMTAMDLKDSSSIFSDCDHLIILHRQRVTGSKEIMEGKQPPNNQAYEPLTLVRMEASRYNPGGETLLYFHGEWSRFDPVEFRTK
jgi:twinkle protein